jgi:hypothetical protein
VLHPGAEYTIIAILIPPVFTISLFNYIENDSACKVGIHFITLRFLRIKEEKEKYFRIVAIVVMSAVLDRYHKTSLIKKNNKYIGEMEEANECGAFGRSVTPS